MSLPEPAVKPIAMTKRMVIPEDGTAKFIRASFTATYSWPVDFFGLLVHLTSESIQMQSNPLQATTSVPQRPGKRVPHKAKLKDTIQTVGECEREAETSKMRPQKR